MASVRSGYSAFGAASARGAGVLAAQTAPSALASLSTDEQIRCLAVSRDVPGLVALGGRSAVEVVQLVQAEDTVFDGELSFKLIRLHTFNLGHATTALSFSARTGADAGTSQSRTFVELCAGCDDGWLRVLTCSVSLAHAGEEGSSSPEDATITPIRAESNAHINAVTFCRAADFTHVVAYASEDGKAVIVLSQADEQVDESFADSVGGGSTVRSYVIPHAHAVLDVSFHDAQFKTLITLDATGSVRHWDWYGAENGGGPFYTLADPKGLARAYATSHAALEDSRSGLGRRGGLDWKTSDSNLIGAVSGTRWLVWDQRKVGGGRPSYSGEAFFEGADSFKWCPTIDRVFAVSTRSPESQPAIKIFSLANPKAPRALNVTAGTRNSVASIAWHPTQTILFAAVGQKLLALSPE